MRQHMITALAVLVFITGCSTVDDYMLGKDNTPAPKALKPVEPKKEVNKEWAAAVPISRKSSEFAQLKPVIHQGLIYSADHGGYITAVNEATGKQEWVKRTGVDLLSGPTISGHLALFASDDASVLAYDLKDGHTVWKATLSSDSIAKPLVAKGKVIAKTIDGTVYAFDVQTGKSLWVADHGAPNLILKASSAPVVYGNAVVVGHSDGKLDALDLDNGRLLWQRSIAFASGASDVERLVDIDADPIIKHNIAYIATYQGYVGALSLTDGQFIWRKPASVIKNMIQKGNTLYYTDSHDVIWSLNASTGSVNWKQTGLKAHGVTAPVVMGDAIYVGDKQGLVHALSSQDGHFIARMPAGGAVYATPLVDGNSLFVLTTNGKLSRYKAG